MKDRRVLITGGAGLIGSHIADALVREGVAEILIVDNFSRGRLDNLAWALAHGPVTIAEADIRDHQTIARLMRDIDIVYHEAAIRITQCAAEPDLAIDVLVNGSMNVYRAAVAAGVEKIITASSASVYGLADEFPTSEQHHPYNNCTLYGAAKAFNEGMLRSFHDMHGLQYVALRYFNVYGPRMDAVGAYTEVFARWLERIESGLPPLIMGDGTQTLDLVHVQDIARANVLAAKANVSNAVFNVGSGTETSLLEIAETLLDLTGSPLRPEHIAERKVNPVRRRLADVSNAKALLGFEAEIGLREGLATLVDWWQEQMAIDRRARLAS
jgi:UDP-glucose 4-epimerase